MEKGRAVAAELLLAATNDAAVIVRRLTAFSDRLEFWLALRLAERTSDIHDVQLRVELPDGQSHPLREPYSAGPAEYYLDERTVHGSVDGIVTFILDWPSRGIADARTSITVTASA
ncbi:hypothetical protein C8N24_0349 [Solirubrobacter pauli]|uniref:Uncharacterized protein n=1 Tax=Solirubrobacter pauli TaxID=166793 RepID=A0A660L9H2_9ACTN|nr:hypothetical protein [Solirubrobacter pauli]RKQ90543.1 hypothetical protein C8N24_0349 [Solirubrobacter pauli]